MNQSKLNFYIKKLSQSPQILEDVQMYNITQDALVYSFQLSKHLTNFSDYCDLDRGALEIISQTFSLKNCIKDIVETLRPYMAR